MALCFGSIAGCDDPASDRGTALDENRATDQSAHGTRPTRKQKQNEPKENEVEPKPSMAGFARAGTLSETPDFLQENNLRNNRRLARLPPRTAIRWAPERRPAKGKPSPIDERFPIYALVTNHVGATGVEKSPLWLATTYRGIRLTYYVDGKDVPLVVNRPSRLYFEASEVPVAGVPIRLAAAGVNEEAETKVILGPGTPVTVIDKTKAYVKGRVEHPGVLLEGYFEVDAVTMTFIMASQALRKPRVNAELVADAAAARSSASIERASKAGLSIQVLDAPKGRPMATLRSNEHTFVEVDVEAKQDGFRRVVVHTTPVSLRPVVAGPVVSGWVHESQLIDVKPRELDEWPEREQPMPEAGSHGPASGEKRNLQPRTILLAEPDGQVVGAVVSDGVSATPQGGADVVLVNNGFGSTFSLYLGGTLFEEKRRSRQVSWIGRGPDRGNEKER
jgi:hypothetical protein